MTADAFKIMTKNISENATLNSLCNNVKDAVLVSYSFIRAFRNAVKVKVTNEVKRFSLEHKETIEKVKGYSLNLVQSFCYKVIFAYTATLFYLNKLMSMFVIEMIRNIPDPLLGFSSLFLPQDINVIQAVALISNREVITNKFKLYLGYFLDEDRIDINQLSKILGFNQLWMTYSKTNSIDSMKELIKHTKSIFIDCQTKIIQEISISLSENLEAKDEVKDEAKDETKDEAKDICKCKCESNCNCKDNCDCSCKSFLNKDFYGSSFEKSFQELEKFQFKTENKKLKMGEIIL